MLLLSIVAPLNNLAIFQYQEATKIYRNGFAGFPTKKRYIHRGSAMCFVLDEYDIAVDSPPCGLSVIPPWYHLAKLPDLDQKFFFSLSFEATVMLPMQIFGHKLADCFGVDLVVCLEESIRECQILLGLHVVCECRSQVELG